VDALVSVIDVRPVEQTTVSRLSPHLSVIDPGAREFALTVLEPGAEEVTWDADGPRIILAVEGDLTVSADGRSIALTRGEAVFVADSDGPVTLAGTGSAVAASGPPERSSLSADAAA
jgi:mannose-6-phosphate isomerase class I